MTDNLPTRTVYPPDSVSADEDNGTMPTSVDNLATAVVGRRIAGYTRTGRRR